MKAVAEGLLASYESLQLNMQDYKDEYKRRLNVMPNINANEQRQHFASVITYAYTTYGHATCY